MALPPLVKLLAPGVDLSRLVLASMLGTMFLVDALNGLAGRRSILEQVMSGDVVLVAALGITVLVSSPLHELPNTAAAELVYADIPFSPFEIGGVSVLVLTLGWLFLVVVALSVRVASELPEQGGSRAGNGWLLLPGSRSRRLHVAATRR
jgi:hypothetical protein